MIATLLIAAALSQAPAPAPDDPAQLRAQIDALKKQLDQVHAKQDANGEKVQQFEQLRAKIDAPQPPWYEKWESWLIAVFGLSGGRGLQLLSRARRVGWVIYAKLQAVDAATQTLVPAVATIEAQIDALAAAAQAASQKPYDPDKIARAFEVGVASLNKIKQSANTICESVQGILDAGK